MKKFNILLTCLWLCVPVAILIAGIYLWYPKQKQLGKIYSSDQLFGIAEEQRQPVIKNAAGEVLHLPHGISAIKPSAGFMKVREGYILREDAQIYAEFKFGIDPIEYRTIGDNYFGDCAKQGISKSRVLEWKARRISVDPEGHKITHSSFSELEQHLILSMIIQKRLNAKPPPETASWTQTQWNNYIDQKKELQEFLSGLVGIVVSDRNRYPSRRAPSLEDRLDDVESKLDELDHKLDQMKYRGR